jgi:hypothetical protein
VLPDVMVVVNRSNWTITIDWSWTIYMDNGHAL